MQEPREVWREEGGAGSDTVLLLHGLGATAAVWAPLVGQLGARRWVTPDLPGHGESAWCHTYSVGQMAAALAPLVADVPRLYVVGHSLGAYVALALASGWFGVAVQGVVALGPRINWTAADLARAREVAARPAGRFATAAEALTRYRRVSGLGGEIAPGEELLQRGIAGVQGGWRLAQDARTFGVAGAPFRTLVQSAGAPVVLARGAHDPMVTLAELAHHGQQVREIAGRGHNAHVEDPRAVLELVDQLTGEHR
ncbi:MAG: alpha/beta fold hydrolase [Proteobacteria bacterium]|nr:alpha/beta fold hydrolase [Pseudomonadota bacterium]